MKGNGVIAIRREEKNKWQRRCVLTPKQVANLVSQKIKVLVQPSTNRCYTDFQFQKAGAIISEDISQAATILGVKEVPIDKLIPQKSYFFFAHIIKAQEYNMHLMDKMLEYKIRHFDYQCIKDTKPPHNRLVAFGQFAGIAGMADFFRGIGEFLLQLGNSTPFMHQGSCYMYSDLDKVKESIFNFGKLIKAGGLQKSLTPMIFVFTSDGRVSKGAQEIFKLLPHQFVDPDKLAELVANPPDDARFKVYGTIVQARHMVKLNEENQKQQQQESKVQFNKADYYQNPQRYRPIFHQKYAPYASFIINCMYWDQKYHRLITNKQMKEMVEAGKSRLIGVSDITCDYAGSIQFLQKFTTIEDPFVVYDPLKMETFDKISQAKKGDILFHAVDHLPAELPIEASKHFGQKLEPFIVDVAKSDGSVQFIDQKFKHDEIKNSCLMSNGKLNPRYQYIAELRAQRESQMKSK